MGCSDKEMVAVTLPFLKSTTMILAKIGSILIAVEDNLEGFQVLEKLRIDAANVNGLDNFQCICTYDKQLFWGVDVDSGAISGYLYSARSSVKFINDSAAFRINNQKVSVASLTTKSL